MKWSQDRFISLVVVVVSILAWGWNCRIVFFGYDGKLTSTHINELVVHYPIVCLAFFGLGCWSGFRKWLRDHPLGLAYLAIVCGHIFWPLPK